jgi:hypothetical protein
VTVRRSAHALYCDDVRQETGNKLSLMGVYQSALFVPTLPFTLPKLCIVVEVRTSGSEPFGELKIEVLKNNDVLISGILAPDVAAQQSASALDAPYGLDDSERIISASIVLQLAPFQITESNFLLRTRVTADGEVLKAGGVTIKQQSTTPIALTAPNLGVGVN